MIVFKTNNGAQATEAHKKPAKIMVGAFDMVLSDGLHNIPDFSLAENQISTNQEAGLYRHPIEKGPSFNPLNPDSFAATP